MRKMKREKGDTMELTIARDEFLRWTQQLYLDAFPACERKPFEMLEAMQREGRGQILAITGEGNFLGMAVVLFWEDIVLLDYLAVASDGRGRGTGSEALRLLRRRFPGRRLLIEIEQPDDDAPDNFLRVRRRQFYLRAGFQPMEIRILLGGVPMELLSVGGGVSWEEYRRLQVSLIGEERVRTLLKLRRLS